MDELGLEEALEDGAALIEWPERRRKRLPRGSRCTCSCALNRRTPRAILHGPPRWRDAGRMPERDAMRNSSRRSGWGDADVTPLPGDASTRRYARLQLDGRERAADGPAAGQRNAGRRRQMPAKRARRALGYNAVARLAGADCSRFAAVADYLRGRGLAAPQIHAADLAAAALSFWRISATRCSPMCWPTAATKTNFTKPRWKCWRELHAEARAGRAWRPACRFMTMTKPRCWPKPIFSPNGSCRWRLGRAATEAERAEHRALVAGGAGPYRRARPGASCTATIMPRI